MKLQRLWVPSTHRLVFSRLPSIKKTAAWRYPLLFHAQLHARMLMMVIVKLHRKYE